MYEIIGKISFYEFLDYEESIKEKIRKYKGVVEVTQSDTTEIPYTDRIRTSTFYGLGPRGGLKTKKTIYWEHDFNEEKQMDIYIIYKYVED